MTKKLSDYADEIDDFGQAKDFVLGGVWESLDHAPTFTLADGSCLRPLTSRVLLRRRETVDGEQFDIVTAGDLRNAAVIAREPEPTWRIRK